MISCVVFFNATEAVDQAYRGYWNARQDGRIFLGFKLLCLPPDVKHRPWKFPQANCLVFEIDGEKPVPFEAPEIEEVLLFEGFSSQVAEMVEGRNREQIRTLAIPFSSVWAVA